MMTGFFRSARRAERTRREPVYTGSPRPDIGRVITRGDYELAGAQFIAQAYCALRPAGLPPSFPWTLSPGFRETDYPATLLVSCPAYRQLHRWDPSSHRVSAPKRRTEKGGLFPRKRDFEHFEHSSIKRREST